MNGLDNDEEFSWVWDTSSAVCLKRELLHPVLAEQATEYSQVSSFCRRPMLLFLILDDSLIPARLSASLKP